MANKFIFANLARSSLSGSITNTDVSLNVQAGGGPQFPDPLPGEQFALTLTDAATGLLKEVVYVVVRSGDTMTIVRGQEGYTALNWTAGAPCANLWTAGQAAAMLQTGEQQSQGANYAVDTGVVNAYVGVYDPVITAPVSGMPLRLKAAHSNTGPSTFNPGSGLASIVNGAGAPLSGGEIILNEIFEVMWNGAAYEFMAPSPVAAIPIAEIHGLTSSKTGTDGVAIITGRATNDGNNYSMVGPSFTKLTDTAWSAGMNGGCLDTGAASDDDFYLFIIGNPSTGAVDYLSSLSLTAPTFPAGYTKKRLIGWFRRSAGALEGFRTFETAGGGLEYIWFSPPLDVNGDAVIAARTLFPLSVPDDISVKVMINAALAGDVYPPVAIICDICSPFQGDFAPSFTLSPLSNAGASIGIDLTVGSQSQTGPSGGHISRQMQIRTDTSKQIAARASASGGSLWVVTTGFEMSRR